MAHARKETLVKPPDWWKHLRPFNKRRVAKKERRAAAESFKGLSRSDNELTQRRIRARKSRACGLPEFWSGLVKQHIIAHFVPS